MNDHEHRYYLAGKTYTEFLPYDDGKENHAQLYTRTEYAIMTCHCGDVQRMVVRDA